MGNLLRKVALPTTIVIFCALIAYHAYVASTQLKTVQRYAAARVEASNVEEAIATVRSDVQSIETGQQGYLLTGDPAYLAPFTNATGNLALHFANLRARLANSAEQLSAEAELERVVQAKIGDANETIHLREKGYRHRAFLIVDSNRGKELVDRAHVLLDRLSTIETSHTRRYDADLRNSVSKALSASLLGSLILLALTVLTLLAFHSHGNKLEREYDRQKEQLRATTARLEQVIATLSTTIRATVTTMHADAESLLNNHAGFLPRQGQERAETICDGTSRLASLLDDLLGDRTSAARERIDASDASDDAAIMAVPPSEQAGQRWGTVA